MPISVVTLDLAAGVAHIAGRTIAVRARPGGALDVGGRVVRPLRFGERWRVLDDVADSDSPLGATVLAHAGEPETADESQVADDEIGQIIALHLAGARPERAVPGFATQLARLVAAGWSPRDVFDADADLVDLLTAEAPGEGDGSEWTSIVVAPDQPASASLADTLRALERNLLDRMGSTGSDDRPTPSDDRPRLAAENPSSDDFPGAFPTGPEGTWPSPVGSARTPSGPEPLHLAATVRAEAESQSLVTPTATDGFGVFSAPVSVPQPIRLAWSDPQGAGGRPTSDWPSAPAVGPRAEDPPDSTGRPESAVASTVSTERSTTSSLGSSSPYRATLSSSNPAPTVVDDSPTAARTAPGAAPGQARLDVFGLADQLATLLDEESELRGLRR
jgi:hypothetical protein